MSGSAQRARRLVSGGWVLLATPVVWLAAASLLLAVQPVRVLSPLVWVLTALWVGNLAVGLVGASRRRPRPADHPDENEAGVMVTPEEQPDLWRLVRDAARAAGLQPPDELRLTAVGHVAAWPRRRTRLDLGVPLLFVLDPAAVAALVARALAVAESGWTDAADSVDRFRWLLQGVSGRQLPSGVATQLLHRLDRQRAEGLLEADDVATRIAGRPTVGRALAWAQVVHSATLWWFDEYVLPELLEDGQPRPLLPGLEALLGDPLRQRQLMRVVSSGLPTGDGAVPGLADRVYGLQTGAEMPDLLPGAAATELLRTPSTVLDLVAEATLGHTERPRTWSEALDAWAVRTSHSSAAILAQHAPHLGGVLDGVAEKRLAGWVRDAVRDAAEVGGVLGEDRGGVLDGVAEKRLAGWVRDAVRDAAVDAEELGSFLLTGMLADAMAQSGSGRISAGWSGVIDVVGPDGAAFELPRVARMVVDDPDLVPELRTMLTDLGVSLTHRPSTGEARPGFPLRAFLRATGPRRVPGTGFPAIDTPS